MRFILKIVLIIIAIIAVIVGSTYWKNNRTVTINEDYEARDPHGNLITKLKKGQKVKIYASEGPDKTGIGYLYTDFYSSNYNGVEIRVPKFLFNGKY